MKKVKNMNKKRIVIGISILIFIILIGILILLFINNNNKETKVEIPTVRKLYKQLELNEEDNKDYRYKLYGYAYDENQNVEMSVMQGYVENNKVYDMNGQEIGDYEKDKINELLDQATLKVYKFIYKNGKYILEEK